MTLSELIAERDNALSRVRYLKQLLVHARDRASLVERLHQAEHVLDEAECRLAAFQAQGVAFSDQMQAELERTREMRRVWA